MNRYYDDLPAEILNVQELRLLCAARNLTLMADPCGAGQTRYRVRPNDWSEGLTGRSATLPALIERVRAL